MKTNVVEIFYHANQFVKNLGQYGSMPRQEGLNVLSPEGKIAFP